MIRFPPIPPAEMSFEQRRVARAIAKRRKPSISTTGGLTPSFATGLYSAGILDRFQALGEHLRFSTSVSAKLRELAIIITARHINAQTEFIVHAMEAREFGVAEEVIDAVAADRRPAKLDEDEALVYEFCKELHTAGRVSDELFERADKRLGQAAIVDLIATCGYYAMLGLMQNVSQLPLSDKFTAPFPVPSY